MWFQAKAQARLEKDAKDQMQQLTTQFTEFNEKMKANKDRAAAKAAQRKSELRQMKIAQASVSLFAWLLLISVVGL